GPWTRRRFARRCLRESCAHHRTEARRPKLPWRLVVPRQAQRQFRRPHAAGRRARPRLAIRRHHRGAHRGVGGARHPFLGGRLARRQDRRRFRRPARFLRTRRRDPGGLADLGGTLAALSPATMKKLDAALPPIWSRANPVDIAGDADATRYLAAFEALLE